MPVFEGAEAWQSRQNPIADEVLGWHLAVVKKDKGELAVDERWNIVWQGQGTAE